MGICVCLCIYKSYYCLNVMHIYMYICKIQKPRHATSIDIKVYLVTAVNSHTGQLRIPNEHARAHSQPTMHTDPSSTSLNNIIYDVYKCTLYIYIHITTVYCMATMALCKRDECSLQLSISFLIIIQIKYMNILYCHVVGYFQEIRLLNLIVSDIFISTFCIRYCINAN